MRLLKGLNELYCGSVQKVVAQRPDVSESPVLADPVQSLLTFGVNIFPRLTTATNMWICLTRSVPPYVCVVHVNLHVCVAHCGCVHTCVCVCMCMCCYCTCINVPMPFITYSRLWLLAKLPVLASHMTLIWTNGVTCQLHVFCIPHKMEESALGMGIIEFHWSR